MPPQPTAGDRLSTIVPAFEAGNPAVRAQLALIRSISDELRRAPAGSPFAKSLAAQLGDELARLDHLVDLNTPRSGEHAISLPRSRA